MSLHKVFKTLKLALVIAMLIAANITYAQISTKKLDKHINKALKEFNVAGVAVGIVKDGKIVHCKGYGLKSLNTKKKVDKNTLFAIASNTKAFTATALAILVEEGKISWRDKVTKHIPEFKMYNNYVTENFTIEDLLTHRSGLGLGAGDLMIFPDGGDFTIKDIISCFQHFKPVSAFRTKFDYDNLLYIVAGEVIARVSGSTWDDFIKKNILSPLKMNNTYTSLTHIPKDSNLATPHSDEFGKLQAIAHYDDNPKKFNGGAASIYSNVNDLCQWMKMNLNSGKFSDNKESEIISKRTHNNLWKLHTPLTPRSNSRYKSHFFGYGLGWFLKDVNGKLEVSHTGGLPGMLSKTTLYPDLNLGVVVLTNTSSGGGSLFKSITNTITDSYLGLKDNNWTKKLSERRSKSLSHADNVTSKVWETVANTESSHLNNSDFVGTYNDKWFGNIEISVKNNKLWFKSIRSPKISGVMSFYKANTFAIKWSDRTLNADAFSMFNLNENGKAISIKMKGISPNIDFSYDFHDLNFNRVK